MRKISLIFLCLTVFISCKKTDKPSLIGTWVSIDQTTQFTIKDVNGKGDIDSFKLEGDQLTWKLNDLKTVYKVVSIQPASLTLKENERIIYFSRMY
ncbi:hypothetical protein [Pedobacter nototheniae]|uniref:hypothetical protein n=1 Tax=Pedobacter nototheniae TaxID=2488994 RepID=UPI00104052EC|nr:hypothetical protein [Pedobacter nototheniae]